MGGASPVILKKEDIRLPDSYKVIFHPITGAEPITYEVASHAYMRAPVKFANIKNKDGSIQQVPVEWNLLRSIELKLKDRRRIIIALELGTLEFSKEFDEIVELCALKEKNKNQAKKENSKK